MGPWHKSHRGTWRAKQESQSWGPCWSLGRTGDPGSLSQMLRWHLGDRRTKCCSALRSRVTKQEGEGCWSLPADPPRTLHRALCAGGWPLRTESRRVLGFQLPSAKEATPGQDQRAGGGKDFFNALSWAGAGGRRGRPCPTGPRSRSSSHS